MAEIRSHTITLTPAEYTAGETHTIAVPPPAGNSATVAEVVAFRVADPTDTSGAASGARTAGLAYNVGGQRVEVFTTQTAAPTDPLAYSTGGASNPPSFGSESGAVYDDAVGLSVLYSNTTGVANSGNVEFVLIVKEHD